MLKKYFAMSLVLTSLPIYAAELPDYKSIEDTLTQGHLVTTVIKASDCVINNPNPKPIKTSVVVFKPQTFLISKEGDIAAVGSWFTTNLSSPTGNGVDQRYKLIINNSNKARMLWEFFNADTGQKSSIQTIEATCELGKGIKVYEN